MNFTHSAALRRSFLCTRMLFSRASALAGWLGASICHPMMG